MGKTFASLLLTLAVSVMCIPVAYLVGQRSAQHAMNERYEAELDRTRAEHRDEISALRAELFASVRDQAKNDQATRDALRTAGIEMAQPSNPAAIDPGAEPELAPIPLEAFDSAKIGTTYDEIARQFGRDGIAKLTLEDGSGSVTTQYVWEWEGADGAHGGINMELVDGLLNDKTFRE